jgi:hypothetical protein
MRIVLETELGRIIIPLGIQDEDAFRSWIAVANLPAGVAARFEEGEVVVELPPNGLPPSPYVKLARLRNDS